MAMNLTVKLNEREDAFKLVDLITDYIIQQNKLTKPELKTWTAEVVNLVGGSQITGFKNSGQFEKMGWTRIRACKGMIQVYFVQNIGGEKATEDQKAMILVRFAAMLRNHFGKHIHSISLNGL